MDIEVQPNASNELMASGATNCSNNTTNSIESNKSNVNNANIFFIPIKIKIIAISKSQTNL